MSIQTTPQPSAEAQAMLDSLRLAVAKTLERKRRLGHYVVQWSGNSVVAIGEDAPSSLPRISEQISD